MKFDLNLRFSAMKYANLFSVFIVINIGKKKKHLKHRHTKKHINFIVTLIRGNLVKFKANNG